MSRLRVNKLTNKDNNGAPEFVHGVTISGVATATKFKGDGSELTSVPSSFTVLDSGVPSGTVDSLNFGSGISIDSTLNSVATISVDTSNLASLSGATFTGDVQVQGLIGDRSDDATNGVFIGRNNGSETSRIRANGAAEFAGSVSATVGDFTGNVTSDRTSSSHTCFNGKLNGTQTSEILADGSATFAGAISLGSVALPSAGTARIYSRDIDNSLYLQTSSGNRISLLDGSQNSMASFEPTVLKFFISNTEQMRIDSSGDATFNGTITADAYSFANLTEL